MLLSGNLSPHARGPGAAAGEEAYLDFLSMGFLNASGGPPSETECWLDEPRPDPAGLFSYTHD